MSGVTISTEKVSDNFLTVNVVTDDGLKVSVDIRSRNGHLGIAAYALSGTSLRLDKSEHNSDFSSNEYKMEQENG